MSGMRYRFPLHILLSLLIIGAALPTIAADRSNLFFLHHSTGRNLINDGDLRDELAFYNLFNGTDLEFWDHDYNYIGVKDPDGSLLGHAYNIPGDNTDPDGLHNLWTTANAARDSILANHQVIAFKSCYPASAIETDAEFLQRQGFYLEMRDTFDVFLDRYPDKVFVVMSQPPLHWRATDESEATRARAFADWLCSPAYHEGHPNVVCFDFFDLLARPDDGQPNANTLREEYIRSGTWSDSHPNEYANETVCPVFLDFLIETALDSGFSDAPVPARRPVLAQNTPNPFNPSTRIDFTLPADAAVRLEIFDFRGRLVRTLADAALPAGVHERRWDGRDARGRGVGSGVYVYRLSAGDFSESKTLVLAK